MVPPKCVVDSQNFIASVFSKFLCLTYYQNAIYFLPGVQLAGEAQREKKRRNELKKRPFSLFSMRHFSRWSTGWTFGRGFSIKIYVHSENSRLNNELKIFLRDG